MQVISRLHVVMNEGRGPGALVEDLQQVDDGMYEILDGGRFLIGNADAGVVFRYEIEGDELSLSPVITPAMKEDALAHPSNFCLDLCPSDLT